MAAWMRPLEKTWSLASMRIPKIVQACWYYLAIYLNSVLVSICCSHSHQKCWCYVVSMWFPDCMFLFPLQICWGTTTTKSGEMQISIGAQSTKWQTQNPKWTCSQSLHFLQVPLQIIRLRHESSILGGILKSFAFRVGLGEQKFKQNHYCYQCHNREMMQQLDQRKDRFIPDSPLLSLEESNIAVE
jgi:hypothetical protein